MLKSMAAVTVALALSFSQPAHAGTSHPKHYVSRHFCCDPHSNPAIHARPKTGALSGRILRTNWLPSRLRSLGIFRLTSYTGGDPVQGTGTRTALGLRAARGLVAVDPRIIPLGTHLWIEGYGPALAADTGGAVIGSHIDLGFGIGGAGTPAHAQALAWGTRYKKVYIVLK